MKKYLVLPIILMFLFILPSCTDYLDKAPESGLTEEDVFGKYANFKKFFYSVYEGKDNRNIKCAYPLYFTFWDQKHGWDALTDIEDSGRIFSSQLIKQGVLGATVNRFTYDNSRRPILDAMFKSIRRANIALQKLDLIKDASPEEIEDLKGQAYFVRGFAHFNLIRIWGPMPHITRPIEADDQWDIPRLTGYESYVGVALDMDSAYMAFEKAGLIRRDPGPGEAGHLNDPDQGKPNGVAAKALKARALLYAASPLNNVNGAKDWEDAAIACWEAIQLAHQYQYELLPLEQYTDNFYGTKYTNEHLWAWYAGTRTYNNSNLQGVLCGPFQGATSYTSGLCPTQNLVDMFETKWGEPLNTAADREKAIAAGHYNEQDPYANRDPRFYLDIIYNQADIVWGSADGKIGEVKNKANIFYHIDETGKVKYSSLLAQNYQGITRTGYYVRKFTNDMSVKNKVTTHMTDPLLRLTELYLNYAEAANEAYGPAGKAPGASLSAVEALNVVRNRVNMPDINQAFTVNADVFRERIKNERTIELYTEGHRYFDLRRWKDAPKVMSSRLYGMDIQHVGKSAEYPTGFKYTRIELSEDRQPKWKDAMYYLPFNTDEYYKMKNFDTSLNPIW